MADTAKTPTPRAAVTPEVTSALTSYTVLVGAITIATGHLDPQTRRAEVVRAAKGDTFDAPKDNASVLTLLSMKAIRPTSEATGKERVTAATMLKVFKNEGVDAPVVEEVRPVDAPNQIEDPDLLANREPLTV